jgi:hypothetical protein
MCAQCMMGASTALTAPPGCAAWLASRAYEWLTLCRMRTATIALLVAGVVGSAVGLSGTT